MTSSYRVIYKGAHYTRAKGYSAACSDAFAVFCGSVIPAKAGTQLIEKSPRSGPTIGFCPLMEQPAIRLSWQITPVKSLVIHGVLFSLDSRLRGNDSTNG